MTDAKPPGRDRAAADSDEDSAADSRTGDLRAARANGRRIEAALMTRLRVHEREGTVPTSARFLFYELVQAGTVPKSREDGQRADRAVTDALTRLREKGRIPWSWITDETRELTGWRTSPSVADYVLSEVDSASLDRWDGEPAPLILCESRSIAGTLRDTAASYACPIASTNGQARGFLITEVAPILRTGRRRVLYVGDFDRGGLQIEDHSQRTLAERDCAWLTWERIALTEEQARDLPVIQKPDKRYRPIRYFDAVETEALGQARIVELVTDRLDELLPEPLTDVLARQARERAEIRDRLAELIPGEE
jgi:hypothetical protein